LLVLGFLYRDAFTGGSEPARSDKPWTSREKRRSAPVSASERVSQSKCGVGDSENQSKPPRLPQRESLCCSSVQSSDLSEASPSGSRPPDNQNKPFMYRWHRTIANMQQALARDIAECGDTVGDDALDAVKTIDVDQGTTRRQDKDGRQVRGRPLSPLQLRGCQ